MRSLIFELSEADDLKQAGGKAYSLYKLLDGGFSVPQGFVVSAKAFMSMEPGLQANLLQAFDKLQSDLVAVRSSAVSEDGKQASWAGQLDTFLNCTRSNLLYYIDKCRQSALSVRAKSYADLGIVF